MNRNEKKQLRDKIGEHLDVSGTRMTDEEAASLGEFVDNYDKEYRGHTETQTTSHTGWSSDGKYTRKETFTETFTDDMALRYDSSYQDDDGQSGTSSTETKDARSILNWLRNRP